MISLKNDRQRAKKRQTISPTQYVFISFILIILSGAILLYLPISQTNPQEPTPFINALFTATSATCVTGQVVVTTATHWTVFGQIVILFLIQVGGLTFISLYAFVSIYLGKKITLKNRLLIQSAFNQNTLQGMAKLVLMVIKGTLAVEGTAAVILSIAFYRTGELTVGRSIYFGIFHAVSGFCNAGFDVIGDKGLVPYVGNYTVSSVVMALIVIGGIGFTVWKDVLTALKGYVSDKKNKRHHKKHRFELHTKIALVSTGVLILVGATYFFVVEYDNPSTLASLTLGQKILASFFQSITLRTAGFNTIPQSGLKAASKFVGCIFMLIGGSPGGTAGGIKTVTVAIIFCCVYSVLRGNDSIVINNRKIPMRSFLKAVVIAMIMVSLMFFATAALSFTEQNSLFQHDYLDIMYEVSSVLGTVGLSTGITPFLSFAGKCILILCMFIGRIGPITVVAALSKKLANNESPIDYPEEEILIG